MLKKIALGAVTVLLLSGVICCGPEDETDGRGPTTTDQGVTDSSAGTGVAGSTSTANGLYQNGVDGSPLLALIQSATKSLDIEIYEMSDTAVKNAVLAALGNGIAVRLVYEPQLVGSQCAGFTTSTTDCSGDTDFLSHFQSAGGQAAPFNKQMCGYDTGCVEHGKMILVDGTTAMVSTGNFAASSLCDAADSPSVCNVDYSYILTDAAPVAALEQIFSNDLAQTVYDVSAIATPVSGRVTVSPVTSDDLVSFVSTARTSITIENQYLHYPALNSALTTAAGNGVQVTVIVASLCSFGTPSKSDVNEWNEYMGGLSNGGVTALAYTLSQKIDGFNGYMHAKTIVVDGTSAWIGSVNGSKAAFEDNREFGVYLTDPGEVQKLAAAQQAHFAGGTDWSVNATCKGTE